MTSTVNSQYLSYIKTAVRTNQRPTAFLFQDYYFGFRDWFTAEPEGDPHYTEWDFALASAMALIEDYTDNETGHLIAYEYSPRVEFTPERRIKKSKAAVDRMTNGDKYKPEPGESWVTKPNAIDGGDLPTISEWIKSESERKTGENGSEMPKFSRRKSNNDEPRFGPKMELPPLD